MANIYQELHFCSKRWPQNLASVVQEKALTDFVKGEEKLLL